MLESLNFLRGTDVLSLAVKFALAVILGGIIGLERELKHRPAGFRTHILISIGSAMTTMTSIYLYVNLNLYTDISRLGASVIAGMGFVGAGAIIVTKNRKVKGLTTAAGFWVTAIIGLAVGAGYYEGAVSAAFLVVLAEVLFTNIEYRMLNSKQTATITVAYSKAENMTAILTYIRENGLSVIDIEVGKSKKDEETAALLNATFNLQLRKSTKIEKIIEDLNNITGVVSVRDDFYNELKK